MHKIKRTSNLSYYNLTSSVFILFDIIQRYKDHENQCCDNRIFESTNELSTYSVYVTRRDHNIKV